MTPFKNVEGNLKLLVSPHNDICDLNNALNRGGKL